MSRQKLFNIRVSGALKCYTKKLGQGYFLNLYRWATEIYIVSAFFACRLYSINFSIMRNCRYRTRYICRHIFYVSNFIFMQPNTSPHLLPKKDFIEPLRSCRDNQRVFNDFKMIHRFQPTLLYLLPSTIRMENAGLEVLGVRF